MRDEPPAEPLPARYFVQATPIGPDGQGNGAVTIVYYDSLSRVITSDTAAFEGSPSPWIRSETDYDRFGRVAQASRPYFAGYDTPVYTVTDYAVNALPTIAPTST